MGQAVRSAFNVQPVTEAFFKDCKAAYEDAVESLAQSIDREDAEQFAQTLFNRLLFIHFVSKQRLAAVQWRYRLSQRSLAGLRYRVGRGKLLRRPALPSVFLWAEQPRRHYADASACNPSGRPEHEGR